MNDEASSTPADDLATMLFALDVSAMSTSAVTRQLTDAVVRWALGHGWTPRVEARVEAATELAGARLGYVDVVVHRPAARDLAIEIDSGDKPWSVDKLRHAARAGMHAIWIRWGDQQWAGTYEDVDVIQLWLIKRPARRRGSAQMVIW